MLFILSFMNEVLGSVQRCDTWEKRFMKKQL